MHKTMSVIGTILKQLNDFFTRNNSESAKSLLDEKNRGVGYLKESTSRTSGSG